MSKQTIISISREFGSMGHHIAGMIASDMGLKLYDRSILDEMAKEKILSLSIWKNMMKSLKMLCSPEEWVDFLIP